MQKGSGLSPMSVTALLEKIEDSSRVLLDLGDGVKARILHHAFIVGSLKYARPHVLLTDRALYLVIYRLTLEAVTWTDHTIRSNLQWTLRRYRHDHETLWLESRLSRHPTMRGYHRLRGPNVPELAGALAGLVPPELADR